MTMKKFILMGVVALMGLASCSDYLDVQKYFTDRQDLNRIFNSRDYTEEWLANGYAQLLNYNLEMGHTRFSLSNFSDDMIFTEGAVGITYSNFRFGQYGPQYTNRVGQLISEPWKQSYQGIRQASIMLENLHTGAEIDQAMVDDYRGQALFLRGYLYWLLVRKYGPVPILPETGLDYEASYDELALPRNTYDECAEYISEQMIKAAELLPLQRFALDGSRPTRGAALATRAKILVYAASPLMNGNTEMAEFTDDQGKALISQEYDESKWAKAAAACLDVIKLNRYKIFTSAARAGSHYYQGAYPATLAPPYLAGYSDQNWPDGWADIDPQDSYQQLFNGDLSVTDNPELIFSRGSNQTTNEWGILSMTEHEMPVGPGGNGWNCHSITGKMCDAYAMNTGAPFVRTDAMKGFTTAADQGSVAAPGPYPNLKLDVWKEYGQREPRFYASVAFNGSNWAAGTAGASGRDAQVFYYYGDENGRKAVSSNDRWLPTGIGIRKFVNPKDSKDYGGSGTLMAKVDPAIRYADILLLYAESLNELTTSYQIPSWDGKETYTVTRDVAAMKEAVRPVRVRAGVPNYQDIPGNGDPYLNANELRAALKKERMIEFLGENQRYYDLRRWKDAPAEEGAPVMGCNTTVTRAYRELYYEQVVISSIQTAFSKKQYWWPIAWEELRRNKRLTQAPEWPSFD
jgi:hypothetical protein